MVAFSSFPFWIPTNFLRPGLKEKKEGGNPVLLWSVRVLPPARPPGGNDTPGEDAF
jgi:hypothetical protein